MENKDKEDVNIEVLTTMLQSLNDDIQRRLGERPIGMAALLTAFATLASTTFTSPVALFIFPWFGFLIALWQLHNEISVQRKTYHMRMIERDFVGKYSFLNNKPTTGLLSTKDLPIEAIFNLLIVGCEIAALLIGIARLFTGPVDVITLVTSSVLAFSDLFAIWLTVRCEYGRRARRLRKRAHSNKDSEKQESEGALTRWEQEKQGQSSGPGMIN